MTLGGGFMFTACAMAIVICTFAGEGADRVRMLCFVCMAYVALDEICSAIREKK